MMDLPANLYVFFGSKPFEKDLRTLKVQISEQEYTSVAFWVWENLQAHFENLSNLTKKSNQNKFNSTSYILLTRLKVVGSIELAYDLSKQGP